MSAAVANRDLLVRAALALGPLTPDLMFVGGSVVGLLAVDAVSPPRPTDDVDVVIEVPTTVEYQTKVSEMLRGLGFEVDTRRGAPLCRWLKDGLVVDVMPIDGDVLGFKNKWYALAFAAREEYRLTDSMVIHVVSAPFFIATKLEAFSDRGKSDYLGSADLEDIIAVVDGRPALVEEMQALPPDARRYLASEFSRLLANRDFVDALPGHLGYREVSPERLQRLLSRLLELSTMAAPGEQTTSLPIVIPSAMKVAFTIDRGSRSFRQVVAKEFPDSDVFSVDDGSFLFVHPHAPGYKRIEAPGRVLVSEKSRLDGEVAFIAVIRP